MLLPDFPKKKTDAVQINPRRVFCVIEHAYQNHEIAEAVCRNRFAIAGTTLDLEGSFDWRVNPLPNNEEWQIEWHKFYYGLDLAHAFSQTGDVKFLRVWEKLVRSFIRQVPVDFASADVLARRVQNWIYARQIFAEARYFKGLSGDFEREFLAGIAAQTKYLRENLTPERNHRTLELYALFIVALGLPQLDKNGELLRLAMRELHENILSDIQSDGVHREQSTHYHCTVLRSFLGAKVNARRFNLKFPESFDERLLKACEFAMHIHRPDGVIPAFSDSDTGDYSDLLKLAGKIFERKDFLYAATRGREGTAPRTSNTSFKESGYFIQRSGWGAGENSFTDEGFLMFDCGRLGDGGHGHYDLLNIEISANGKPLIVDSGRYTYAENNDFNWRKYFKGTAVHNTVCVDGKDQTSYRRGKPKGEIAHGKFIERLSLPNLDVLCGAVFSPNYATIHTRKIFFIKNSFWLIHDNLHGAENHKFDLRFHLTPAAWNHCRTFQTENNAVVRTSEVALLFEKHREILIEPSWFSPAYGIKHRAPCVSVVEKDSNETDFYTLVVPLGVREVSLGFTVKKGGAKTVVEICRNDTTKEVLSWELNDDYLEDLKFDL